MTFKSLSKFSSISFLKSNFLFDIKKYSYSVRIKDSKYKLPLSVINLKEVENFPLCNSQKLNGLDSSKDIYNINIFEGGYRKLPSVTNILTETMPKEQKNILSRWEAKKKKELGEDEFMNYKQVLFDRGKIMHDCIEMKLKGERIAEEQLVGIEKLWISLEHVLHKLSDTLLIESRIIHPTLHYQGAIDCIAKYKNIPVAIEFKSSSSPKLKISSTYDNPLQLLAYVGALNFDSSYSLPNINGALLVIAYSSGFPAHIHYLDEKECQKYWSLWLKRLSEFWKLQGDLVL